VSAPHHLSAVWRDADAMRTQGNLAGARDLLEPVADVAAIRLGVDNPDVIETMRRLATVHRELGELASARRVLEEALEGALLRMAEDDPVVLGISAELGAIAAELGNRHEARRNLTRVARYGPGVFGPQHPYVRVAQRYLGADAPVAEPGPEAQAQFTQPAPAPAQPGPAPVPVPAPQPPPEPGIYRPGQPTEAAPQPRLYRPDRVDEQTGGRHPGPEPEMPPAPIDPFATDAAPVSFPNAPSYEGPPVEGPRPQRPANLERPRYEGPATFQGPHDEEAHRSRTPMVVLAVVAVAAVAAAAVVAVLAFASSPKSGPLAGPTSSGVVSRSATPSPSPTSGAPTDVKLRDAGDSVTLTWTDPSGGSAPFLVEAGKAGVQLTRYAALPPGQSTYTVIGLNPKLDYCFTIVAVYGTDLVAPSDLVCTKRTAPSPSR
jgi:Tetratricopeptide repeat/Fibronectin type III domain